MVTGESEETLREGRRVEAVVRWVGSSMARCSLPEFGNLEAILNDNDISSSGRVNPADRVQVGATLPARCVRLLFPYLKTELGIIWSLVHSKM